MRDDLHHSFPLNHPWRKVVQAACGESMGWDIKAKLERAAWAQGADWVDTAWGAELKGALSRPADLFGNGRLMAELRHLESSCPSVAAKRALDCAFAEVQEGRSGPDLFGRVVAGANRLCAEDGIENAVSRVADEHGHNQARQLRVRLEHALGACELAVRPVRKAVPKPTVEEALGIALDLKE